MSTTQVDPAKIKQFCEENEQKLSHVFEIMDSSEWEILKDEKDITFYKRSVDDSSIVQIKSIVVVDTPLSNVLKMMKELENEQDETGNTITTSVYGPIEDGCATEVFYVTEKIPVPLVSSRDYLIMRRHYSREGKEMFVHHSIECEEIKPLSPDYARGKVIFQVYIGEAIDKNTSKFTFVAHLDPCGSIPAFVINMALVKQGSAVKNMIDKHLKKDE